MLGGSSIERFKKGRFVPEVCIHVGSSMHVASTLSNQRHPHSDRLPIVQENKGACCWLSTHRHLSAGQFRTVA